jgi:hypothetical protein
MAAARRKQWETQMTKTSIRGLELAISLLRKLSQVMNVRSRLVSSEPATIGHRFYGLGLSMKEACGQR